MKQAIEGIQALEKTLPRCGMIFEFKNLEHAKRFAEAFEKRFSLMARVFEDSAEAERSHAFPWNQKAPVVHTDRPHWFVDADHKHAWDSAWANERQIEALAKVCGVKFVGTWWS
jgi:hypothetical protein